MKEKKISLRGISEILSEKELKNVMGGSAFSACGSNYSCWVFYPCLYGFDYEDIPIYGECTYKDSGNECMCVLYSPS